MWSPEIYNGKWSEGTEGKMAFIFGTVMSHSGGRYRGTLLDMAMRVKIELIEIPMMEQRTDHQKIRQTRILDNILNDTPVRH